VKEDKPPDWMLAPKSDEENKSSLFGRNPMLSAQVRPRARARVAGAPVGRGRCVATSHAAVISINQNTCNQSRPPCPHPILPTHAGVRAAELQRAEHHHGRGQGGAHQHVRAEAGGPPAPPG
jgi:hypothetical protein